MFKYLSRITFDRANVDRRTGHLIRQGLAALITLLCSTTVPAADYHDLEQIRLSAETHIRSVAKAESTQTEISAGRLDVRLKLAHCPNKLETYLPNGTSIKGQVVVGVRCTEPASLWSIFVPVSITHYADIAITTRSLARGQVITASDVKLERRPLTRLYNGYLVTLDQVIGKELKQSVPQGSVLSNQTLQHKMLIKRGQHIVIIAKNPSIYVRSQGVALSDGRIGGIIKVKNSITQKIVEGTITSDGIIEIKI